VYFIVSNIPCNNACHVSASFPSCRDEKHASRESHESNDGDRVDDDGHDRHDEHDLLTGLSRATALFQLEVVHIIQCDDSIDHRAKHGQHEQRCDNERVTSRNLMQSLGCKSETGDEDEVDYDGPDDKCLENTPLSVERTRALCMTELTQVMQHVEVESDVDDERDNKEQQKGGPTGQRNVEHFISCTYFLIHVIGSACEPEANSKRCAGPRDRGRV